MSDSFRARVRSRGFSVLEAVLVLALVGLVLGVTIPRIGSSANPAASDSSARVSLGQFLSAETALYERDRAFSQDPAVLAEFAPSVVFVADPAASSAATVVSVKVTGSTAAAAALSDSGSCWYLRTSFLAPAGTEPVLWAVDDSPTSCVASEVLAVSPGAGEGDSPANAYVFP